MAQGNFSSLRKQACYIDEVISDLDSKLEFPGSIYQPSKRLQTERILENIMAENEDILRSINEDREITENNIQEQENLLHKVNEDILKIINEQRNIEVQLQHYGYLPMPETPTALHEKEGESGSNNVTEEQTDNDSTSYVEQFKEISLGSAAGAQYVTPQRPLEPMFSKYYYEAFGLPVPAHVSNNTVNRTYT